MPRAADAVKWRREAAEEDAMDDAAASDRGCVSTARQWRVARDAARIVWDEMGVGLEF
jgi:hypothetical protein